MARIPYAVRQRVKALPGVLALEFHTWRRGNLSQLTTDKTRLCLEAFPRSGNGFSYTCLRDVLHVPAAAVAHHTHSAANVRRAVARGLPTYVLVREPYGCCVSLVVWGACRTLEDALRAYEDFHTELLAVLHGVTILRFEEVTASPGGFVALVAERLGLEAPAWDEAVAASVKQTIHASDEERRVADFVRSSLPTAEKEQRKQAVIREQGSACTDAALARCRRTYARLLGHALTLPIPIGSAFNS